MYWRGVGVLALLACLLALPAAAQETAPTEEELGLEVLVGYGDRTVNTAWTPVEVTLAPRRPVAARLVVESRTDGGAVHQTRAIEVAAASRKVFRFLAPTGGVRVLVQEEGRRALAVRPAFGGVESTFLVGVLGAVAADAPPLRSQETGLNGAWVPVAPEWPELHEHALDPLSALVADEAALADLTPAGREHVAAAVVAGLDLVVVPDGPGALDLAALGLPASPATDVQPAPLDEALGETATIAPAAGAWTLPASAVDAALPGAVVAAATGAGRGRVAVSGAPPGSAGLGQHAGFWNLLVGPNPRIGAESSEWAVTRYPWQFTRLLQEEGAGVPQLPWLAAFIAGYVFVVGPVNGLVLARFGRRELAWVTVPLVTAVFTAGAFLGATGGRPPVGVASAASYWLDGVGAQVVAAGVRAPTPGVHAIDFQGEGWQVRALAEGGQPATVAIDGSGLRVRLDLTALQLGGAIGWRTVDEAAPLSVDAVATAEGVEATVTNTSSAAVRGVVVRAATNSVRVGDLAAGASETVAIDAALPRRTEPHSDLFFELGANPATGAIGPPRSMEATLRATVMDGNPGLVWAVGWTEAGGAEGLLTDGAPPLDRGQVVAVGTRPALPPDGTVSPFAVRRGVVLPSPESYRPSPLAVEGPSDAFLRFRLPPGGTLPTLYADLGRAEQFGGRLDLTVWHRPTATWVPVPDAFPRGEGDPAALVSPLGEVWVRASGDLFPFEFSGRVVSGVES